MRRLALAFIFIAFAVTGAVSWADGQADLSSTSAAAPKKWGQQSFNDENQAKVKAFVDALLDNSGRLPASAAPAANSNADKADAAQ